MKPEIITLANKVLHDLNFDKTRTTTQIVAEAISNYAEQQVKTCNKPAVIVPLPDSVEAYKLADIAGKYLYEGVTGELRIGTKGIIAIIEEYNKM